MRSGVLIKLSPMINKLNEVKISAREPVLIKMGSQEKQSKYVWWQRPGLHLATFMEGSKNVKGIVRTVGFYLTNSRNEQKGDITAPFRIRLFKVDADGMPGQELLKEFS